MLSNLATRRWRVFVGSTWFFLLVLLLVTGCPDPISLSDDTERDLDRPLPVVGSVDGSAVPDYNTRPVWTWTGCEAEGTQVFRYRINGGEWVTQADLEPDGDGRYSYDLEEADRDLYPGTYEFEVQERNSAGNWSQASRQTTRILVEPPILHSPIPSDPTNDPFPQFSWSTAEPPQYGNGETGLYSWRMVRWDGAEWIRVSEHGAEDLPATEYSVTERLTDGVYRFGIAERNTGGERSAFFVDAADFEDEGDYVQFRVDTVPPNPPVIASDDLRGPAGDRYVVAEDTIFTWTSGGPDGIGDWEYRVFGPGYDGETVPGTVNSLEFEDLVVGEIYTLEVRERDAAGNWSEWASVTFEVRAVGTISIEDPVSPTLEIDGEPVVRQPDPVDFIVEAGDGIEISSYSWSINGDPSEEVTGATVGGDPPGSALEIDSYYFTLGGHTLTLMVVINGVPYSEQFGFVIVDE